MLRKDFIRSVIKVLVFSLLDPGLVQLVGNLMSKDPQLA